MNYNLQFIASVLALLFLAKGDYAPASVVAAALVFHGWACVRGMR